MEFSELQKIAQETLNERRISRLATAGTVAAAFLTDKGNVYTGVCIDVPAGISEREVPMLVSAFVKKGIRHVDNEWSMKWVQSRIIDRKSVV